jgi:hypothetical protein
MRSRNLKEFVVGHHDAMVGEMKKETVLDMTAIAREGYRKTSTEIANEKSKKLSNVFMSIRSINRNSPRKWISS